MDRVDRTSPPLLLARNVQQQRIQLERTNKTEFIINPLLHNRSMEWVHKGRRHAQDLYHMIKDIKGIHIVDMNC